MRRSLLLCAFSSALSCAAEPVQLEPPEHEGMRSLLFVIDGLKPRVFAFDLAQPGSVAVPLDEDVLRLSALLYSCPLDVLGFEAGELRLADTVQLEGRGALAPNKVFQTEVHDGAANSWIERDRSFVEDVIARLAPRDGAGCRRYLPLFAPTPVAIPDSRETMLTFAERISPTHAIVGTLDGRLFTVSAEGAELLTVLSTSTPILAAHRTEKILWMVGRGLSLFRLEADDRTVTPVLPPSQADPEFYAFMDGNDGRLLVLSDAGRVYLYEGTGWTQPLDQERNAVVDGNVLITGGISWRNENDFIHVGVQAWSLIAGNPVASTPNPPEVHRYVEGVDTLVYLSDAAGQAPTFITRTRTFGQVVGTFSGGLAFLHEDGFKPQNGELHQAVLSIVEYGGALLYGGGQGIFSAWHPDGGYCAAESYSRPEVRGMVAFEEQVLLLSRPTAQKDDVDQAVTFLRPLEPPLDERCR